MKLLLDQGFAQLAAALLKAQGHDCVHVADVGLAAAPDETIIASAKSDGRVVVTMDADFHDILAKRGAFGPSVIRFRVEDMKAAEQARQIRLVIGKLESELKSGCLVTVAKSGIRARGLPIKR
ncbi:MAG: DUF5615 family PIN-like protein [Planctomycetes bacterium]|nr:DUF5615 family PIN-like protein [Planctomycetota bacterium]